MKWNNPVSKLIRRYQEIILYLFFGALTVAVNTICYELAYEYIGWSNLASTLIAWLIAVIFAFFTNKNFVFQQQKQTSGQKNREFLSFISCRAATGVLDVLIMLVAVDVHHGNSMLWKTISNVVVIVINYVASKYLIFKRRDTQ